jgi:hypothetical protein
MAVRADQLAFGDFVQHTPSVVQPSNVCDLSDLGCPGKVVPRHGGEVERAFAVRARRDGLQLSVPGPKLPATLTSLRASPVAILRVIRTIVFAVAFLTPCLTIADDGRAFVKPFERLRLPTFAAALHPNHRSECCRQSQQNSHDYLRHDRIGHGG